LDTDERSNILTDCKAFIAAIFPYSFSFFLCEFNGYIYCSVFFFFFGHDFFLKNSILPKSSNPRWTRMSALIYPLIE